MSSSPTALVPWFLAGLPLGLLLLGFQHSVGMAYRAKRAEVPGNLESLHPAVVGYQEAFEALPFSACGDDGSGRLGKAKRRWREEPDRECFQDLGWAPDGGVRGSYLILPSPDGLDFVLMGFIDIDGDGQVATYAADSAGRVVTVTHPRRVW